MKKLILNVAEFKPDNSLFAKGGLLEPKDAWDRLSIPEKADIIKVGVKHGIFDLQELRRKYNEFKEGGSKEEEEEVNTEKDYINTMERVAEENYRKWGYDNSDEALLHALNDNTYNYRGYYEKYPQSAANADTHWSDEFKTVYHPTFSRESIYSGLKSQYNPDGLVGGHWINDTFIPAPWQIEHKHSIGGPLVDAAMNKYRNARHWKHELGGNLFFTGGPEDRGREEVTNLSVWDELAAQSPLLYTIGKAIDPTGISGYGDAREAINQYDNAPSLNNGYTAVMETLGALPIVSKAGKAIKFLQGVVTGQGIFDDYNHAQEKMKEYGDELVIDYWDNTVKLRREAEKHGEQMKSKMSYTDVHHLPSFKLAPKGSKPGQIISNYTINHRVVNKYKKSLGGNLFGEAGQMQIGLNVPKIGLNVQGWPNYTTEQIVAYGDENERRRKAIQEAYLNFVTESNDATVVANGRRQNQHLVDKAVRGAKAHAAWEKEHPILNTVGLGLSAIPFVAAASPILAPTGEAFAGATLAGISAPMWTDAALTAGFGAHGLNHAINEGIDGWGDAAMTTLEVAPLGRLAKPMWDASKNNARAFYDDMYIPYKISKTIDKGVKENAVITAYNRNPTTKDIGNLWDYQYYLDNVFPNSKVKGILWHGSISKNLQTFSPEYIGSNTPIKKSVGMYLAPERATATNYGKNGDVYPVLLNTENPFITNQFFGGISKNGVNVAKISPEVRSTLLANNDAVIAPKRGEIAFFNPDDALILGSDADVAGFRKFMSTPQITAENTASITRYDLPSNDIIIESSISANPNIPFDEAWLAASKGRHQMSNLVGSGDYASRVKQAYQDNGIPVNQADFEILQAKQSIEDSNLKVVPNLKSENGEILNGQYDPNTRQVLVSQDRDNILDVVESSGHEHAHASEVEKLLELLKEKWKHIKPRKEAFTRSDGSIDTEWKDYISKIVEMRAPAMSVWSQMKDLGFNKVGDYLHHLKRFGLEDKQWEALVNRYGLSNAKYMVETVFGVSPFVINGINNEEKDSTTM